MTSYILGAGISGLLCAYYSGDTIVSDNIGWAAKGATPLLLLHDSPASRRVLDDMGLGYEVKWKPIGYRTSGDVLTYDMLTWELTDLYFKKMTPWNLIRRSRAAHVGVDWPLPSRRVASDEFGSGDQGIVILDVDAELFVRKLLDSAGDRGQLLRRRVTKLWPGGFETDGMETYSYGSLVSTLPAPVFERLWIGDLQWRGRLHYIPLTIVLSVVAPDWWSDHWAVVYSADMEHPACRIARVGEYIQYEIVGQLSFEDRDVQSLFPVSRDHVFPIPYGRIIQDVDVTSPYPGIEFMGRFAEWKYNRLTAHVMEKILEGVAR